MTEQEFLKSNEAKYVRHRLAGQISNLSFCLECIEKGQTHFQSGKSIMESAKTSAALIQSFVASIPM